MADNKHFTHHLPVIMDENSALPFAMSASLGEAGNKYVKSQHSSNYQLSKNLSMMLGDDDETITFAKQHWYFERPIIETKRVYTGSERGKQWNDVTKQVGTERIDYPDAFDDIVWEHAQSERDAAEKDVLAYVTWYKSKREYKSEVGIALPNPIPSVVWADNTPPPSMTNSAETIGNFKKRILETLKGNAHESLFAKYVNEIMNRTRVSARKVGKAKAKTNPLVEEVLKTLSIDEIVPD